MLAPRSYDNRLLFGWLASTVPLIGLLVSPVSLAASPPQAPLTFDTTYVAPSGRTIQVGAGGDFQTALNSAQLGDTIILQAGATYRGTYTLPNKAAGDGWIYVISSNYSALPPPGTRVGPSDAVNMPLVLAGPASNALITVAGSNHFRFIGINFESTAGALSNLITIGNHDTSPTTLPNNIIFDRCYVHGTPSAQNIRGIEMDGAYIAVIDSYVSDFQANGQDTQALWAYNTTGPLKIVDNYLEAAGENVLFGGADSLSSSLVPSDIQISENYFFKPLSLIGTSLDVKNLLEFKAAQRVLVSGNTFVNNPLQSQNGFALLVTPRNQDGSAPWSVTSDIAFSQNILMNVGSGITILGTDDEGQSLETKRILISNNILGVTGLNGADGRAFEIGNGGADITIDHNTIIDTAMAPASPSSDLMMADNAPGKTQNFVFTNNLSTDTVYGFFGSGFGSGTGALNGEFANWVFSGNAIVGAMAAQYPQANFFPGTLAAVGFNSYAGGDYAGGDVTLGASSPYKNAATDGLDIGANITASLSGARTVPNAPTGLSVH